jgi:hypothetical protein
VVALLPEQPDVAGADGQQLLAEREGSSGVGVEQAEWFVVGVERAVRAESEVQGQERLATQRS